MSEKSLHRLNPLPDDLDVDTKPLSAHGANDNERCDKSTGHNPETMSAVRRQLLANGYEPIPVRGKEVLHKRWTQDEITEERLANLERQYPDHTNTGLRTGGLSVVDIDLLDDDAVSQVVVVVEKVLGQCPFRRVGSKGMQLLYRNPDPVGKITVTGCPPGSGKSHILVEFLGTGQQTVSYGIHPDTGQPYTWTGADEGYEPLNCRLSDLPAVSSERIRTASQAIADLLGEQGYTDVSVTGAERAANHERQKSDDRPVSRANLEDMLGHTDPGCNRHQWIAIAGALKSAHVAEEDNWNPEDCFVLWSAGEFWSGDAPGNFESEDDARRTFCSLKDNHSNPAGVGTIIHLAREGGYRGTVTDHASALADLASIDDSPDHPANDNVQPRQRKWLDWPDLTKQGAPRQTCRNVITALGHLNIRCQFDDFAGRFDVQLPDSTSVSAELSDAMLLRIRHRLTGAFSYEFNLSRVREAVETLADQNRFDPVRDYLDGLEWDGTHRLDTWMTKYLRAGDTEYNREVGRLMLLGAVRRAYIPGSKFDYCIVLEGKQGTGKSTALSILGGEWFSDAPILGQTPQQQAEQLQGTWLYELCELQGLHKREAEECKAFVSRCEDRVRHAYARYREDTPRRCILIGTTNARDYLRDMTGNRRFLPVETGPIDLEGLRADRDQLMAEAVVAHRKLGDQQLMLPERLWSVAADIQSLRMEIDPWIDVLSPVNGYAVQDEERIPSSCLMSVLGVEASRQTAPQAKRVAGLMRQLGWEGPDKIKWPDGSTTRGYKRPLTAKARPWVPGKSPADTLPGLSADEEVPADAESGSGENPDRTEGWQ